MSIQDFRAETKRRGSKGRRQVSEAEKVLHDFALTTYRSIEGGDTKIWVKEVGTLLVKNVAPDLSPADTIEAVVCIEGIVLTVLMKLFGEGTLIKKEVDKDETGK